MDEEFAGGEEPCDRQNKAYEDNDAHVIGFPDIDEDFFWVNEVIDGHGIETGFEFIKEEEFNEKEKDLDKTENESGCKEKDAMPARGKSVIGNDEKPGKQRQCLHNGHEKVAMKTTQKGTGDVACGQAGGLKSEKEDHAEHEPGNNEKNAPECRKAVAGTDPVDWRRDLTGHLKPRI